MHAFDPKLNQSVGNKLLHMYEYTKLVLYHQGDLKLAQKLKGYIYRCDTDQKTDLFSKAGIRFKFSAS